VNAAVGIIGDGPVNVMYFGVPAIGIIGALIARLEPNGMARALFAMALAQMAVPVIALVVWNPPFDPRHRAGFCFERVLRHAVCRIGVFVPPCKCNARSDLELPLPTYSEAVNRWWD
jgi:hypothetical protein